MEVSIQEETAFKTLKIVDTNVRFFYIFFHLPTIRGIVSVIASAEM